MARMPENDQPPCADISAKPHWKTFAFHQGNVGAGYPKPTCWLIFAKEAFRLPSFCYEGPPLFDKEGFYLGPLPMAKGMGSIRNRQAQGPFKTSGTEMWPAKMCQWIATWLLLAWASSAATASADVPDTQAKENKEAALDTAGEPADIFPICQPEGERILRGGTWQTVTAGRGYVKGSSRKPLEEPGVSRSEKEKFFAWQPEERKAAG